MVRKRLKKTKFKLSESYASLVLGAIAVLVAGILFISFAKVNKSTQTSSTRDALKMEDQKSNTSSAYTVNPGDDLWRISENIYKDGYKWVEIAKANKLENPGLIYAGSKLIIPAATSTAVRESEKFTEAESPIIQSGSITGNVYKIKAGDNLWNIAVRAYGDGFKWPEIAKANNLQNPGLIHSGNILKIPR